MLCIIKCILIKRDEIQNVMYLPGHCTAPMWQMLPHGKEVLAVT